MKKIMIALLAIAVLFGFAACDNNTTTPSGDEEQTGAVTSGMTKDIIDMVMDGSFENVAAAGELNTRIGAMLGANSSGAATDMVGHTGYTLEVSASAPMTATITHQIAAAEGTTYPAQVETLLVNGKQVGEAADKTFALDSFTYTYEGYTYDASESIVPVKVVLNGWFGDTTLVVTYGTDPVDTSKIISYALPASKTVDVAIGADSKAVSVTVDNVAADSDVAFDTISLSKSGYTYKDFVAEKSKAAQKAAKGYVDLIVPANFATVVNGWLSADVANTFGAGATWTSEYSANNGGSATFTLSPTKEVTFVTVSNKSLILDMNDKLTITFKGAGAGTADSGFNADSFTISGTFKAESAADTAETAFDEDIDITVSGKYTTADTEKNNLKITKQSSANTVAGITLTGTLTADYDDGVVATMDAAVKPELADATLTTAPADKKVALTTDTVELSHPFPNFS